MPTPTAAINASPTTTNSIAGCGKSIRGPNRANGIFPDIRPPAMTTVAKLNPYEPPPPLAEELRVTPASGQLSSLPLAGMVVLAALAMVGTLPGRTHGLGLITEGL